MKEQLLLLSLVTLFIALMAGNSGFGNPTAFAYAAVPQPARTLFSNLYERAQIWYDKAAEGFDEFKQELEQTGKKLKGDVQEIVDKYKDAVDKKASQEDLDALKKELNQKADDVQEAFDKLQTENNRLKDQGETGKAKSIISLAEEGLIKMRDDLKAKGISLKQLWEGSPAHGKEVSVDLKAVSNITTGYALTGANSNLLRAFDMEPGVAKDPTAPYFITDLISTGTTDAATIYWTERVLVEGGAGQVAEAAKFPQISAKYQKFSANAKKTAAYSKVTEEAVEDVEFILSEIQDEIISGPNSIRNVLENQLLTGDGTGENHKGIFNYAKAFAVPTGLQTLVNPNNYDAAKAAILQVIKKNFQASTMLVNPSDLVNMELTKDANGNYVMPPFIGQNGMVIAGVRVVANNRVAEGAYLVGEFKRAKLFIKRQLTIKFFDQNEDDALNDLRTITGSTRGIFRLKGPDTFAFVSGTFNATKTAIKTV